MTAEKPNMATNPQSSSSLFLPDQPQIGEAISVPFQLLCALLDAVGGEWTISKGELIEAYPPGEYTILISEISDPHRIQLRLVKG